MIIDQLACKRTNVDPHEHTRAHTRAHTHTHLPTHARTHTHTCSSSKPHTHIHTCIRAQALNHIHTCTHTHTHTHVRSNTHTHTHTHVHNHSLTNFRDGLRCVGKCACHHIGSIRVVCVSVRAAFTKGTDSNCVCHLSSQKCVCYFMCVGGCGCGWV
jgi:hypothetical protein